MKKSNELIEGLSEIKCNYEHNFYNSLTGITSLLIGISTKGIEFSNKNLETLSKGYAWDFLSVFALYNLYTATGVIKNKYLNAGISFVIPSLAEIAQKLDLISGTYDPKDLIIYGTAAGIGLGIDKTREYFSKINYSDNIY